MVAYSYTGNGFNTAALVIPDLYIAITPQSVLTINGVPTNLIGIVGTASYGPVNFPTLGGTNADYSSNFGAVQNRKYDAGTQVATAVQNGATAFCIIRVTDGTDIAATAPSQTNNSIVSPSFVAPYTGTGGAGTQVQVIPGRTAGSWAAICSRPGRLPERFDNGFTSWGQLIAAINTGVPSQNVPPSALVVAVVGSATTAGVPSQMTFTLSGGTDGSAVSTSQMVGIDGLTPTGAYGLRGQGCSVALCADLDDTTGWSSLDALGQQEGIYFINTYSSGSVLSNNITTQATLGLSAFSKSLYGDWLYWLDTTNQLVRLVSQQGFTAGKLASLQPQESGGNKPISGVIGSQQTGQNGGNAYPKSAIQAMTLGNLDSITNPVPGGNYWGLRTGRNSSSNPGIYGDSYPRLTSFIARSLGQGMGLYVQQVISVTHLQNIRSTLLAYLGGLYQQGILVTVDGTLPYSVVCDTSNNTAARVALGYVQADVQVRYPAINDFFIVNLQGGSTVSVTTQVAA